MILLEKKTNKRENNQRRMNNEIFMGKKYRNKQTLMRYQRKSPCEHFF